MCIECVNAFCLENSMVHFKYTFLTYSYHESGDEEALEKCEEEISTCQRKTNKCTQERNYDLQIKINQLRKELANAEVNL